LSLDDNREHRAPAIIFEKPNCMEKGRGRIPRLSPSTERGGDFYSGQNDGITKSQLGGCYGGGGWLCTKLVLRVGVFLL